MKTLFFPIFNMNYYISDLHFGHKNIIKFDERPFQSAEEMDAKIIENWNNVVKNGDNVYVVGDMFWCKMDNAIEILNSLNGNKFLVKGNHDRCHDGRFLKKFIKVSEYMEVDDDGRKVVLCHYPIPYFKNHYYGWYHLYGHVHATKEYNLVLKAQQNLIDEMGFPCNMYNVGCMMQYMNYTPRTLNEIILSHC